MDRKIDDNIKYLILVFTRRAGDLKLIRGDGGSPDGWIKPENVTGINGDYKLEEIWGLLFGEDTSPTLQEAFDDQKTIISENKVIPLEL